MKNYIKFRTLAVLSTTLANIIKYINDYIEIPGFCSCIILVVNEIADVGSKLILLCSAQNIRISYPILAVNQHLH